VDEDGQKRDGKNETGDATGKKGLCSRSASKKEEVAGEHNDCESDQ
jgi:hypothetical protein